MALKSDPWEEANMDCPWSDYARATIQFCERELCGWITQPANTWSNIGYVLVGVYLFRLARRERPALSLIGISSFIVGIGSGLFHASGTFMFEFLDLLGMFLISGLLVVYNLQRLAGLSPLATYSVYSVMTTLSLIGMLIWRPAGIPIFAAQIALALTFEVLMHLRRDTVNYKEFMKFVGTFVVSFGFWGADISGAWCNPDNHWINGHAIWHLLDAVAIYFVYTYYLQFDDAPKGKFTLEKANG